jgi:hypothetical protein
MKFKLLTNTLKLVLLKPPSLNLEVDRQLKLLKDQVFTWTKGSSVRMLKHTFWEKED